MVLKNLRIKHAAILFFALLALLPAIVLAAGLCGCRVTLLHEPVGLCLSTAALLLFTVFAGEPAKADRVFAALLPFMAVVHILFHLYLNRWLPFLLFMVVDSICAWVMFARFGGPKALKTVFCILSALLYAGLVCLLPGLTLGIVLSQGNEKTVVQSVPSPDGKQIALVSSYESALDHDTTVEVSRGSADLFLLRIEAVQWVYFGEWSDAFDMALAWRDSDTLLINGRPYDVP